MCRLRPVRRLEQPGMTSLPCSRFGIFCYFRVYTEDACLTQSRGHLSDNSVNGELYTHTKLIIFKYLCVLIIYIIIIERIFLHN